MNDSLSTAEKAELHPLHIPLLTRSGEPVFEDSPLGIVATDLRRQVIYANAAARAVLGLDTYKALNLSDVFVDSSSIDELNRELAQRRRGKAGNYRATVKHQGGRRDVHVDITGVPLFDGKGEIAGALGIFRSLHVEDAIEGMLHHMLAISESGALLSAIAQDIREVIPFDLMIVTRYSGNGHHAKIEFTFGDRTPESLKVWHHLSPAQRDWLGDDTRSPAEDPGKIMDSDVWSDKRQEEMSVFIRDSYKAMLRRNVKISSRTAGAHRAWLAASISLFSRNAGAFDATHERMFLFLLPVDQAVLRAIDRSRRFPQQRQALVEAVNSCTTIQQACKVIAEKLRSTFGWQQVCVYRVDYAAGKLRLSSVSSAKPEGTRPPEHSQSIKAGILGRAVESKQIDKVDDAENDADYVKAPHQENVGSVLCCPIVFEEEGAGRVVRFVIDVDDRHENAFSSDDEEDLNGLMPELANSLQRISKIQYLQLCFERSSDAIIVTDSYFNVRGANDAALKLLGAQDATGLSGSIAARFQNRAQFEVLARLPEGDLGDLVMVPVDDKLPHVPVFVARQDFPDSLGGSVFIARDTRTIRRSLELELLSDAAYEVAIETSTPLSLALDQLETLATLSSQDTRLRLLKILRQLKRVKHAYDKLALFNERARPAEDASFCAVDLCMELESICKELTDEQMELVAPISAPASLVVRGDPYQISTVFETLLSALIRTIPENQKVGVSLRAADGSALVSFIGKLPPDAGRSDRGRRAHEARMELQVAHPLLESFMRNHGGEISRNSLSDGREEFTLKFPLGVNDDKTHFSRVQPAGS